MRICEITIGIVVSSFVGIMAVPETMVASNSVLINGVDLTQAVATEVPLEVTQETPPQLAPEVEMQVTEVASTSAATLTSAQMTGPANQMQILGKTIELSWVGEIQREIPAGLAHQGLYYKNGKFIYGHNTAEVLGVLGAAYDQGTLIGTRFGLTMDGAARQYTVRRAKVYTEGNAAVLMGWITEAKLTRDETYDLALMTCYGADVDGDGYPDGRLVVFAD